MRRLNESTSTKCVICVSVLACLSALRVLESVKQVRVIGSTLSPRELTTRSFLGFDSA